MHDFMTSYEAPPPKPSPLPVDNPTKSFWHTEPVLQGHRTTADLPKHVEYVIVGSGITGTSALRYLVDAGVSGSILMLEAREACWGATGRNGGHLQPLLLERSADVVAFEVKNCSEVSSYIQFNNIDCEFRSVPACRTFWKDHMVEEAKKSVKSLQQNAPELAKLIHFVPNETAMLKAGVLPACNGASITQGAASLWPYKYVTWILSKMIAEEKVNLQTNTPVTKIYPTSSSSNRERYVVSTARGDVTTTNLLLATNAYTSHLIPSFSDLIVPVRETMTALIPPKSMTERLPHTYGIEGLSPTGSDSSGEYLIQRPAVDGVLGPLMLGGGRTFGKTTIPSIGEADDSVIDPAVVGYLQTALPHSLTLCSSSDSLASETKLEAKAAWTGIWAASRDGNPFVGPVPDYPPGIWLCAAYTGHGMPNATLCAKAAVRMMLAANAANGNEVEQTVQSLCDDMVEKGDLPKAYILTTERIKKARKLPDVEVQDNTGKLGCFSADS